MLNIDTNTFLIEITRGDSASIVFSAVDEEGVTYTPTKGDKLCFAVARTWGKTPMMKIETVYDGSGTEEAIEAFWTINIETDDWLNVDGTDKFKFSDYVYDVQILTSTGAETIIGKTDEITPTFRVWGEAAEE